MEGKGSFSQINRETNKRIACKIGDTELDRALYWPSRSQWDFFIPLPPPPGKTVGALVMDFPCRNLWPFEVLILPPTIIDTLHWFPSARPEWPSKEPPRHYNNLW